MSKESADLSWSSLDVLFEYVENRAKGESRFKSSVVDMYDYNALRANWLVRFAVMLLGFFLKPRYSTISYFFWGTKFDEIILDLPVESVCVVGGPKQLLFCLRNRRRFLPSMALWRLLSNALKESRSQPPEPIFREVEKTAKSLSMYACEDAVFIVDNDSLPMQRAMIISASKIGLKSVCIQHGIFQSKSPSYIMDGWFADSFLVINEAQKTMLVEKGMCSSKIKVMGFHASPYMPSSSMLAPKERRVCFLGQPWGKYDEKLRDRYLDIVTALYSWAEREGVDMFYKPHPWELGQAYLGSLERVVNISLKESFETYDVFVSLTSTALIEAAAAGRIAIQIRDDVFDADDFSIGFGIFSVHATADQGWMDELKEMIRSPVNEVTVHDTPVQGFLRSLNEITSIDLRS